MELQPFDAHIADRRSDAIAVVGFESIGLVVPPAVVALAGTPDFRCRRCRDSDAALRRGDPAVDDHSAGVRLPAIAQELEHQVGVHEIEGVEVLRVCGIGYGICKRGEGARDRCRRSAEDAPSVVALAAEHGARGVGAAFPDEDGAEALDVHSISTINTLRQGFGEGGDSVDDFDTNRARQQVSATSDQ